MQSEAVLSEQSAGTEPAGTEPAGASFTPRSAAVDRGGANARPAYKFACPSPRPCAKRSALIVLVIAACASLLTSVHLVALIS
ncbi:MAG: hypothetical protein ACT4P1_17690 [Sporichthyaceae bacterium]